MRGGGEKGWVDPLSQMFFKLETLKVAQVFSFDHHFTSINISLFYYCFTLLSVSLQYFWFRKTKSKLSMNMMIKT